MARKRGTWGIRLLTHGLTVALALLAFWLLGFIMDDIESIPGPVYTEIEARHMNQAVVQGVEEINKQITDLDRQINATREQEQIVGAGSSNLQSTINQLLELQRLSLQEAVPLTETEQQSLSATLNHFLENQKRYQELNQRLADLSAQKVQAEEERDRHNALIEELRTPAREEFNQRVAAHRLRLAAYQLAILVPLLLVAGYVLRKHRAGMYFPLVLAGGGAVLVKSALVMHEYFPARLFRYILILALIAVVVRLLIHLIRAVGFPKAESVLKQYRESYERFLCPECDYPIRTGPRRYLYWTRRTVHKALPQRDAPALDEPYVCPACGTTLFEPCSACQRIRHSLLPHCEHCGAKRGNA
jgi:predicted RNA-binding Zn-ribbon protein involved in translation (DUF1610 family)